MNTFLRNSLTGTLLFLVTTIAITQNIKEVEAIEFSKSFLKAKVEFDRLYETDKQLAIDYLDKVMPEIKDSYERFYMFYWNYAYAYYRLKKPNDLLKRLKEGQAEGLSYNISLGERMWPPWAGEIKDLDDAEQFFNKNETLIKTQTQNAVSEYFVITPDNYNPNKKYPLLIVLHGGTGSHRQSYLNWTSETLHKKFIVAYLEGIDLKSGHQRRFISGGDLTNINAMTEQILEDYPIYQDKIFIGGPSAGGARSLLFGLQKEFPTAGLLLTFPVIPRNFDDSLISVLKEKNMKIVLLTGENDSGIPRQKKLAYLCDLYKIPNRFVIFSEKGHEYPDNFSKEIDLSIDFLLKAGGEEELID